MNRIFAVIEVLYRGKELANAEAWKRRQVILGALTALLPALAIVAGVDLSDADVQAIAAGVAALAGCVQSYLAVATSARVGLPPRRAPGDPGGTGPGIDRSNP